MSERDRTFEAHEKLRRALDRLTPAQGRVARANARRDALAALKAVRAAVDAEYPSIPKATKKRPKLQPGHKVNRLKKHGFVIFGSRRDYPTGGPTYYAVKGGSAPALTAAVADRLGVRIYPDPRDKAAKAQRVRLWAPSWLVEGVKLGLDEDELRRMHKSKSAREALLASAMLTADDD